MPRRSRPRRRRLLAAAAAAAAAAAVSATGAAAQSTYVWKMSGCRVGADGRFSVSADADCDVIEHVPRERPCTPVAAEPDLPEEDALMLRMTTCAYADGVSAPELSGPSARAVSNAVAAQTASMPNSRGLSDWLWQWGQFVDHDLVLSHPEEPAEPLDIPVPAGDPFFDPAGDGDRVMPFSRSAYRHGTVPREQTNLITPLIDASNVYGGDDAARVAALRAGDGTGRLATSGGGALLPLTAGGPYEAEGHFLGGDVRANEQSGLTAVHTLWVREHNRVADELRAAPGGGALSGDEVYARARRVVTAEIQAVTYEEWLPLMLGEGALPPYAGHDASVDGQIANEFASGAYRVGHTQLSGSLRRATDAGELPAGPLALRDAFFTPGPVLEHGIEPLLCGLATQVSQEIDTRFVDDVRNFLFGPPGSGGHDLFSLNLQRGRDHGLPRYNDVREQLGFARATSFADVAGDDAAAAAGLASVYASVDEIDFYAGGLAEPHVDGSVLGETFHHVIRDQFLRLRDADPDFYLADPELAPLASTRLADVIKRNAAGVDACLASGRAFVAASE